MAIRGFTALIQREAQVVFRGFGWPAIQAALDNLGYARDPSVQWARTFPKIPRGPRFDDEVAAERVTKITAQSAKTS